MARARGGFLALALAAALLAGCGDDAEDTADELRGADQEAQALDARAMGFARGAQAALEAYFVDNSSYVGATPETLVPGLPADQMTLRTTGQSFELTLTSESGNTFTVTRDTAGSVTATCQAAGTGGCPANGQW